MSQADPGGAAHTSDVQYSAPEELTAAAAGTRSGLPPAIAGLILGAVAGLIGGLAVNRAHHAFRVIEPPEVANTQGIYTPEQRALVQAAHLTADYKNAPLTIGLLGLIFGGLLGASGFLAPSPSAAPTRGVITGVVTGLILGAAGGALAITVRQLLAGWNTLDASGEPDPLKVQLHAILIHFPSWASVALAGALAVIVSSGRSVRTLPLILGAGLVGILLASIVYPTAAALLFTGDDPDQVIPTGSSNQILWTLLFASLSGLFITRQCGQTPTAHSQS